MGIPYELIMGKTSVAAVAFVISAIVYPVELKTPEERTSTMNDWMIEYFDYFNMAREKNDLQPFKNDMNVVKELMVLNWMYYLKPDITEDVKTVLSDLVQTEENADSVVDKLKKSVQNRGEVEVTTSLVRYQIHKKKGNVVKSTHDTVREYVIRYTQYKDTDGSVKGRLSARWKSADLLKKKAPSTTEKATQLARNEKLEVVPAVTVHDSDMLMCVGSIYLVFHADNPPANWKLMQVDLDSKLKNVDIMYQVPTSFFNNVNWRAFTNYPANYEDLQVQQQMRLAFLPVKRKLLTMEGDCRMTFPGQVKDPPPGQRNLNMSNHPTPLKHTVKPWSN